MVFRAASGNGDSVYHAWTEGNTPKFETFDHNFQKIDIIFYSNQS